MKKILVVDDDPDILFVIKHILRANDFDVKTHPTGYDVPAIVEDYNPDLILLDIRLPGKQGTEICKELKEASTNLPVILFSAHADEGKAFKESAANDFISKPFEVKNLLRKINQHIN